MNVLVRAAPGTFTLPENELQRAEPILTQLCRDIGAEGFDRKTLIRIERLLHLAEYKRRQAPPGVKLGSRNFGRDRRYPITQAFRTA